MQKRVLWLKRPRYSPIEFSIFILIVILGMSFGARWVLHTSVERDRRLIREALIKSPLPDVAVAKSLTDTYTDSNEYNFSKDWVTRNVPVWEIVLEPFKGRPGLHYLEIGAYEGRSVLWMLENILTDPSARATVIDLFDGPYRETYLRNIQHSECLNKVTTLTGFSQVVLRSLPLDTFDIIYIDGSHEKDDTLEDAVLSWRLLKRGGLVIFDDYRLLEQLTYRETSHYSFPKPAIDAFVQCFENQCEVVHNEYQLIIRKKDE